MTESTRSTCSNYAIHFNHLLFLAAILPLIFAAQEQPSSELLLFLEHSLNYVVEIINFPFPVFSFYLSLSLY